MLRGEIMKGDVLHASILESAPSGFKSLLRNLVAHLAVATHVITKKASKYGGQYEQNLEFAPQRNSNGGIVIVRGVLRLFCPPGNHFSPHRVRAMMLCFFI